MFMYTKRILPNELALGLPKQKSVTSYHQVKVKTPCGSTHRGAHPTLCTPHRTTPCRDALYDLGQLRNGPSATRVQQIARHFARDDGILSWALMSLDRARARPGAWPYVTRSWAVDNFRWILFRATEGFPARSSEDPRPIAGPLIARHDFPCSHGAVPQREGCRKV